MSFFDPFIERDREGIAAAISDFRDSHSAEDLFTQIARFAVLAYAPSQHGNAALQACLAAYDLRDALGGGFDDVLAECGLYAAMARQPWSEPPILDPPPFDAADGADEALSAAIAAGDRLAAERWLAARLDDRHLAAAYFGQAASTFADGGSALLAATSSWRLSQLLGEKGRYAALRTGLWAILAAGSNEYECRSLMMETTALLERFTDCAVAAGGSVETMRPVLLLDAAVSAEEIAPESSVLQRTRAYLTCELEVRECEPRHAQRPAWAPFASYRLGRDYASALIARAAAARFGERFPNVDVEPLIAAAHANLENGESFEEWS